MYLIEKTLSVLRHKPKNQNEREVNQSKIAEESLSVLKAALVNSELQQIYSDMTLTADQRREKIEKMDLPYTHSAIKKLSYSGYNLFGVVEMKGSNALIKLDDLPDLLSFLAGAEKKIPEFVIEKRK